jgi:hypothetical protein
MIESIECFDPELDVVPVIRADVVILEQGHVGIDVTWHSDIGKDTRCIPDGEWSRLTE